jgi:hypothetical protein
MNQQLREIPRAADPAAGFLTKKQSSKGPQKPAYKGSFPPKLKEVMALRINIFKRSIKERKGKTIWMLGGRKTCNIIDQCTLYTNAG